ncbi:MAG: ATP-binding protein [Butyrivibrio sp.]|nr:ATP-binding protein [Acetatifactor muris]MCM1559269.1 ATP-binding protein [Butyrivibrio sp.]
MGIYLNPGNKGFWESVRSEIYVDKTGLIADMNKFINTEQKYVCVSRPRRFGKSMTLKMLAAYYSRGCESGDLFAGRAIESYPSYKEHLNKYDVVFLNMQQFLIESEAGKVTEYLEQEVLEELKEEYGDILQGRDMGLAAAFRRIYAKTEKQFIFLIDEWDCVMRERQESEALQRQYLDFLRNLFKDQVYAALVYMTGILPVKKYGLHSALNMFRELSMTDQNFLEEYTGFTESEVKALCRRYGMDFAEAGSWYDGYRFTSFKHIYNPKSVVEAMSRHRFSNYWTATESYEALKIYIDMDFDGLRTDIAHMLGGGDVRVNTRSFQNDMRNFKTKDDVLTLLIHLGYLAYDSEEETAFIPNREIIEEFENAMSVSGWPEIMRILKASDKLLQDTLKGDAAGVAAGLDRAHTEAASILTYNDENSLACAIGLAYYSARKDYRLIRELPAGHGYADIVFLPLPSVSKPAIVVELKYDKTAHTAIQQIKDRHYTRSFEGYTGEILTVGINYDRDNVNKPHSCVIERLEKQS